MAIEIEPAIPVLRIFDLAKAMEFYRDFLGCTVDWEHRFGPDFPVHMQVSRGRLRLHLTEHHGGGSPGASLSIPVRGIDALHAELTAKQYRFNRPGIETQPWGMRELTLTDPFGNRLSFTEPDPAQSP